MCFLEELKIVCDPKGFMVETNPKLRRITLHGKDRTIHIDERGTAFLAYEFVDDLTEKTNRRYKSLKWCRDAPEVMNHLKTTL